MSTTIMANRALRKEIHPVQRRGHRKNQRHLPQVANAENQGRTRILRHRHPQGNRGEKLVARAEQVHRIQEPRRGREL